MNAKQPTRLGLKLNFLMPSKSVVFFCLALSNLLGSSAISGVGCRNVSTLPLAADSLSNDPSGVTGSRLRSSPGRDLGGAARGSSIVFPAAVPHATNDRNTAARHSKPCLFSWFSDKPMTDVSMVPETDNVDVIRDGVAPAFWLLFVGLRAGLGGSLALCCAAVNGVVPILEMIFMRLKPCHKPKKG